LELARNDQSTATAVTLLDGRTLGVAVGTIDTAVPWEWPQNLATAFAVIKELTGVHGHLLSFRMTTIRAGDC
jgi:hypothetical protein